MTRSKLPIIALAIALLLGVVNCAVDRRLIRKAIKSDGGIVAVDKAVPPEDEDVNAAEDVDDPDDKPTADNPTTRKVIKSDGGVHTVDEALPPEEEDVDKTEDEELDDRFGIDKSQENGMEHPEPGVQAKQAALVQEGSKGEIEWGHLSKEPCHLAGHLKYEDMVMTFDINDTGIIFEEADGTVPFAAQKKRRSVYSSQR
jgi:hypothetical protein